MFRNSKVLLIVVSGAAGLGAFFATVSTRAGAARRQGRPLEQWLGLSPDQGRAVESADPTFAEEAGALEAAMSERRVKLAESLEDPATPPERILEQVELVLAAQGALARRVAKHVLAVRPHLSAEQQGRLLGLCASSVRAACDRRCWRCQQGAGHAQEERGGPAWRGGETKGARGRHGGGGQ